MKIERLFYGETAITWKISTEQLIIFVICVIGRFLEFHIQKHFYVPIAEVILWSELTGTATDLLVVTSPSPTAEIEIINLRTLWI